MQATKLNLNLNTLTLPQTPTTVIITVTSEVVVEETGLTIEEEAEEGIMTYIKIGTRTVLTCLRLCVSVVIKWDTLPQCVLIVS